MRNHLITIARSLGRFAVAALSAPGAAAAAGWITLETPSYSAPLLGGPGGLTRRMA